MTQESGKGEGSRTIFTRLADAGEEAIRRVGEMPGGGKLAEPIVALRERVDELQRRVLGLDAVERRLADVERRVAVLEGAVAPAAADVPLTTEPVVTPTPPSSAVTDVPPDDPTAGTAASEETATS
jgi:hypothetical protein